MKRFPDVAVVSWQCSCKMYLSHSIDLANLTKVVRCSQCGTQYSLDIGEIDIPVKIKERKHGRITQFPDGEPA